jgi:TRAP-type C4-dicarboxylate transport system permease small subunit
MRVLNKILDKCNLVLAAIASVIILLLILAVSFSTLSRYLFNKPFSFLTDYSTYSLLFVAFLGAPWLMQQRGHTALDIVVNALPEKARHIWVGVTELVIAAMAAVLVVVGVQLTQTAFVGGTTLTDTFGTPKWILLSCIPLGCFFLALQSIRNAVEDFVSGGRGEGEHT